MYEILTVYVDEESGYLGIKIENKVSDKFKNEDDLSSFLNGELILNEVSKLLDETSRRIGLTK